MRKCLYMVAASALIFQGGMAQETGWQPAGEKILTEWAAEVNPSAPLPEYPRPQMVRENWVNLNGLWNYAITAANAETPSDYEGQILVPFAVESALSGVGKRVGKDNALWYSTRDRKSTRLNSSH